MEERVATMVCPDHHNRADTGPPPPPQHKRSSSNLDSSTYQDKPLGNPNQPRSYRHVLTQNVKSLSPPYATHHHSQEYKDRSGIEGVTTFYIENLPHHVDPSFLRFLINRKWKLPRFGTLRDVYIPNRRNKAGRRFGFIRFDRVVNIAEMEFALDHQYIGASALRSSLEKYGRRKVASVTRWSRDARVRRDETAGTPPKVDLVQPKLHVRTGEEGAERPVADQDIEETEVVDLTVPAGNVEWLNKSAVGVLRRVEDMSGIQELVLGAGWFCETRMMGRGLVLLEFDKASDYVKALAEETPGISEIFTKVIPWREAILDGGRLCWVQCTGLPIQAWGNNSFEIIGRKLGGLVVVDDHTILRKRLDVARILISTSSHIVEREIMVRLEGELFKVCCQEEPRQGAISNLDWMVGVDMKKQWEKEEEDEEGVEAAVGGEAEVSTEAPAGSEQCVEEEVLEMQGQSSPYLTGISVPGGEAHASLIATKRKETKIKKLMGTTGSLEMAYSGVGSKSDFIRIEDEDISNMNRLNDETVLEREIWDFGRTLSLTDHANEEALRALDRERFERKMGKIRY